jgi:uncharacterized RDD family membrane protein YckC
MGTPEPTFSWGSDALERAGGGGEPRACGRARSSSLLGARAAAVIIDGLILIAPIALIDYLMSQLFPHRGFWSATSTGTGGGNGVYWFLGPSGLLLATAITFTYFFVCEAVAGRTIGKARMGLRVTASSGEPAGLNAISTRTVLRLLDVQLAYLLGAFVAIVTGRRRRRIGDWVGGTVVVRDEEVPLPPRHEPWRLAIYPLTWFAAVFLLIFALGLGVDAGRGEEAVALVRSYVQAREHGEAARACSLLTVAQQREVAAIQGGGYATASASQCPGYILREQGESRLLNPGLGQFAQAQLTATSVAGAEVVRAAGDPGLELVAVPEDGQLRLDVRGLQKIAFVHECTQTGRASSATCACTFEHARASGLLSERVTESVLGRLRGYEQACAAEGAARV